MSIITKTYLRCDSCGKAVEADPSLERVGLGGIVARDMGFDGWISTDRTHHLCPGCAKPYLEKKAEAERELRHLAGIDTIEVGI